MITVTISRDLESFVDEQVAGGLHGTSSEYVCALICQDRDRQNLRRLLQEGASSSKGEIADAAYFEGLRDLVRRHASNFPGDTFQG